MALDFSTGAVLVDGLPWLISGFYFQSTHLTGGPNLTTVDDSAPHTPSISGIVERLASHGINTIMTQVDAPDQDAFMENMDRIGIKVLIDIKYPVLAVINDPVAHTASLRAMIKHLRRYSATLGYYVSYSRQYYVHTRSGTSIGHFTAFPGSCTTTLTGAECATGLR